MMKKIKFVTCNSLLTIILSIGFFSASFAMNPVEEEFKQAPYSFPEYSNRFTKNLLAPILKPGKKIYVSINGRDKNLGTEESPFKTLKAARDAVRKMKTLEGLPKGGVQIVLLEGTYYLNEPFSLNEEDSGTAEAPVVYCGAQNGKVIISSGKAIDTKRLKKVTDKKVLSRLNLKARGKVMSIKLSRKIFSSMFKGDGKYGQLSMDGYMLQLAQWPNRGYNHIGKIVEEGPTTRWLKPGEKPKEYSRKNPTGGKFIFKETLSPAIQKEFERTGDMQAQGYFHNDWYFQDESIGKIDSDTIQLLRYTRYGIVNKIKSIPRRVRLFNVLAELDEPGEWYYDKKESRLYVWPIKGFVSGKSSLTAIGNKSGSANDSYLQPGERSNMLSASIVNLKSTSYVTFKNLIFESSSNLAVNIEGGKYNLLAGNVFRNGAGKGVSIQGGFYNGITGCDFYDLYNAFSISGGDFKTLEWSHNFATNNIIRNCRLRGYGVISLSGVGMYFAHNLLYDMNGAVMYKTVNLLMEYNEYYNIGWEMGDFNVAYCGAQWYTMNNVLRYNFVHHIIEPGGHPITGFRNDDNGAGMKVYGNVFYRCGRGSCIFHGFLNDFQNNISMDQPIMWWTLKKPIDPEGIKKRWDNLAKFGRDLPKGDKGDYIYIMEQVIGKDGWKKGAWKKEFPELEKAIDKNPWAQTACTVNLNYAYKISHPFHIHGGNGTVEGLESKLEGKFKDLPKDGKFEFPKPIKLDAFIDVPSLDFRFKPNFKPMANFKIIPFDKIGLVKDAFRTNTPVKKEYRSAVYKRFKNEVGFRYNPKIVNARYPVPAYMR